MANLKKIDEALTTYLRPQTYPVAIRMCESDAELPEKVRLPEKDLSQFAWYLQMGSSDQTIGPFAVKTCSAVTVL